MATSLIDQEMKIGDADIVDNSIQDSLLIEQLESDICDRLRNLDLSQQSIETESDYLIRI